MEQRRREWQQKQQRKKLDAQKQRQRQLALQKQQQRKKAVAKAKVTAKPAPVKKVVKAPAAPRVITNPAYQRREAIKYPRKARRKKLQGTVMMRANIDTAGRVQKAWVLKSSGYKSLDKAAMKSVPRWVFKPAKRDGRAVTATVQFPVVFRLK